MDIGDFVNIQHEEIQEFKWLSYNNILELLTFENSKEILTAAKEFIDRLCIK